VWGCAVVVIFGWFHSTSSPRRTAGCDAAASPPVVHAKVVVGLSRLDNILHVRSEGLHNNGQSLSHLRRCEIGGTYAQDVCQEGSIGKSYFADRSRK
jgi:hypothetical protein